MKSSPIPALRRLLAAHALKGLRYCGVSAVNVALGSGLLWACHAVMGWSAVVSNLSAWIVSTGPAYWMSRTWVWRQQGRHRLGGEVLAFWAMALAGLGLSTLTVGLVEHYTQNSLLVVAGNFCAYGVIWVAKYLYLDQVMWRSTSKRSLKPVSEE